MTLNTLDQKAKSLFRSEEGGIAIPAVMWFAGVPFFVVVLLWLFFFRG